MDQSPSLPLFYKDPVLLRFEEHGDIGLAPASDFSFTREAVALPLCIGEFAVAQRHFPIVFAMDDQASAIALVASGAATICFASAMEAGIRAAMHRPIFADTPSACRRTPGRPPLAFGIRPV